MARMSWLLFVLGALATFRLAHLVSKECGPLAIFERISGGHAGRSRFTQGMGQLHLLFFTYVKRHSLRNPLNNPLKLEWGEWLLSWARFQRDYTDDQPSLPIR